MMPVACQDDPSSPDRPQHLHVIKPKTLQWSLNVETDFVNNYKVYRKQGNHGVLIGTVPGQTDHLDVSNSLQGSRNTFWNTATNPAGESLPSDKVTINK